MDEREGKGGKSGLGVDSADGTEVRVDDIRVGVGLATEGLVDGHGTEVVEGEADGVGEDLVAELVAAVLDEAAKVR